MLRIGMIGSDSSHADRFAEILNRPDHPSYQADADARIVAIWGAEVERTAQVAQAHAITEIVTTPAALLGQVDAVLCVSRHGGLHRVQVQPFLEAGVPTFVDKPLALTSDDARAMLALARESGAPFTSFSTIRFSADTRRFVEMAKGLGGIRNGIYSGPATRRNPYGGLLFYAIHSIELMLLVQGPGVTWVQAVEAEAVDAGGNGAVTALCAWPDGATATLHYTVDAQYSFAITALGRGGTHHATLDINDCYRAGMRQILACLRGGDSPVSPVEMLEAVQIGAAIEQSLVRAERVVLTA
jgi:predicted dehydrogenase